MEGGLVALRLAFANPQTYKGVVTVDTDPITQMLQSKAASAVKAGLKVKLLVDRDSLAKRLAADPAQKADAAKVIASWTDEFTKMGYTGAVDAWSKSAPESTPAAPDPVTQKIVASLRAMQPGTVEAAAPK
jgi:pimeloyl-ACP methyl ester carboxylesterase